MPQPYRNSKEEFKVNVSEHLGALLFVQVQKWHYFQDDAWFYNWISVKGPGDQGAEYRFPCYRWVQGTSILSLPEGTGCTVVEDTQGLFRKHREEGRSLYKWGNWKDGPTLNVAMTSLSDLPVDERFREDKRFEFEASQILGPMLLRQSTGIPSQLMFPPGMEKLQAQLQEELKKGSLFEADFSLLDGIKANVILFSQQYLAAPLVMLKLQPDGQLLPKAIQLELPKMGSTPPIFTPDDPPVDWLLAKCWVCSCDLQVHQLQYHLLRGHLMAEVFSVATMRSLPSVHPVYKLLVPHLLYTLEINVWARCDLISDKGFFDKVCGGIDLRYKTDEAVRTDYELQSWCQEITEIGLQGAQNRDRKAEDVASMDDVGSAEPAVVGDIGPAVPPNGDRA
ncbi:hypothetical protein STEG23_002371 [Scotinomys teguina]